MTALTKATKVAVVGTGAMGAGIAQIAAAAGHEVLLFDAREGAAEKAITGIAAQFSRLAEKGKLSADEASAASGRLQAVTDLQGLSDVGLIVEAIVENLEAKQGLFRSLEAIVAPTALFATNTSAISVTAIGAALAQPERLAGLHFFNPAPLMALVEVVSGLATAPSVAETLFDTAKAWGKSPVYTKSTPGFIVNRVARPFYAEAQRVLQEGGADVATIDACCKEGGGFRMGPFELMDLIGHDVNLAVTKTVWAAYYHDPRFLPSLLQQELVAAGFLGRKSGRGFYEHRPDATNPTPDTAPDARAALDGAGAITVFGQSLAAQALRERLTAAGRACQLAEAADDRIAQLGEAVVYLTDGRTATHRTFASGQSNTFVIDLALDYRSATRLAMAGAEGASAAARLQAVGLLQAAGYAVSVFRDVPGLIVMRTVAMLANEAADAVNQGVCTVAAADTAMRLGVNYPLGPLAWADAIGLPRVRDVLTHLAQAYGEDRYRISPWIHQRVFAKKALYD
ncbi:MAG: hypothetical protein RLZZ344_1296 [Pseudomonadota bacterium]|jgi:3-hydroxybutyryl-CoA dehydrogenase